MIKIYKIDSEWIAAENIEDAKKCFVDDFAVNNLEEDETAAALAGAYEVEDKDLDTLKHYGTDGERGKNPISFRKELEENIRDGVKFPCIFGSQEL